ncbi:hypothetical protein MUO93_06800 [Candidatus Bathyarchaeota archaeon]|nr:hypothetical protein [Candidatus Bathyarchaeota archaeon]
MSDKDLRKYNTSVCPRCVVQVPVTDVSVDERLFTTFYYKCKCGLSWTKIRGLELTQEELKSIVALTKKLLPQPRAVKRF